jgi:hypothetical protein
MRVHVPLSSALCCRLAADFVPDDKHAQDRHRAGCGPAGSGGDRVTSRRGHHAAALVRLFAPLIGSQRDREIVREFCSGCLSPLSLTSVTAHCFSIAHTYCRGSLSRGDGVSGAGPDKGKQITLACLTARHDALCDFIANTCMPDCAQRQFTASPSAMATTP